MQAIDDSRLQVGDIVLTTTPLPTSRVIRAVTKSDISHAMLVVAPSSLIDSTADGVHARNPQKMLFEDECAIHALRPLKPLAPGTLQIVIEYARSETGAPYTRVGR